MSQNTPTEGQPAQSSETQQETQDLPPYTLLLKIQPRTWGDDWRKQIREEVKDEAERTPATDRYRFMLRYPEPGYPTFAEIKPEPKNLQPYELELAKHGVVRLAYLRCPGPESRHDLSMTTAQQFWKGVFTWQEPGKYPTAQPAQLDLSKRELRRYDQPHFYYYAVMFDMPIYDPTGQFRFRLGIPPKEEKEGPRTLESAAWSAAFIYLVGHVRLGADMCTNCLELLV
ncbi:hypothetical protein QBC35DRAFT_447615 [Podospora australis]|uniref:Uncharacterized protein n=1 Tax=Podospora australis TaxID=1536484 RepID=A0AAN6X1S3_9PEZI|nr:hypothetical protein QBC35DRAFT_447615 [Podospora australis]